MAEEIKPAPQHHPQKVQKALKIIPKEIRNLIAGGLAGMVAKTFVAPIDRIKLLYQITEAKFRLRHIPRVVRTIIAQEGPTALWKGNSVTLMRVFPYAGIQFMSYDKCKSFLLHSRFHREEKGLTPTESLFAGSVAGAVSVTCTYPLDLTRAQLACLMKMKRRSENAGFFVVLMDNYKQRGLPGLFRGVTPSLLGIVPYSGVAFAINEQGKRKIRNVLHREPTTIEKMECGALAGLFAQTFTYPLEVTRRRMQTIGVVSGKIAATALKTDDGAAPKDHFYTKPASMTGTMRNLYLEQGVAGFFKGVSMNWLKGPIAFSISFTMYDVIKGLMEGEEVHWHLR